MTTRTILLLTATLLLCFALPALGGEIHRAIEEGDVDLVKQILRTDPSALNQRDQNQFLELPIHFAAREGNIEIMRLLLEAGAEVDAGDSDNSTALGIAAMYRHGEMVTYLIEQGADVNHLAYHNSTALMAAAENGSAEIAKLLVDHGADVNHQNEAGETALIKAAAAGHADAAKALLDAKADPNLGADEGGRSALQLAAIGGHLEAVSRLVAGGADLNAPTPTGETPLDLARYYGHDDVTALLVHKSARSTGSEVLDRSLAGLGNIGEKEAVIWFLGHSGWAVKTQNHLLIFDYFPQGQDPIEPGLCNGHVNPTEMADEKVAVFASHYHGDHYDPVIFEWREQVDDITYFLGLEPEDVPPYEFMPERMEKSFGDLMLTTIHSTDAGVGMVVEADGLTIFHPGDHANGRIGLMDEFTDEIDFLASRGIEPDICLMGILGCSLGRPDEVKEGIHYTLKTLEPKVFIPMHAGTQGHLYREFIKECQEQFPSVQMMAADNRGDHFTYSNGKIKDPKGKKGQQARADEGTG